MATQDAKQQTHRYLQLLQALLENATVAQEYERHGSTWAITTCQEFDRSWSGQMIHQREAFWADLGAPISMCLECHQPPTTGHNSMTEAEHAAAIQAAQRHRKKGNR